MTADIGMEIDFSSDVRSILHPKSVLACSEFYRKPYRKPRSTAG